MNEDKLLETWRQAKTPVIFRREGDNLLVKLPFAEDNRRYLAKGRARRPAWNLQYKCWELPRSAFNELAQKFLTRYGEVHLIQPYNPDQGCCAACQSAKGLDCECACMGKNHGKGCPDDPWYAIGDAFRATFKGREYQVQHVTKPVPHPFAVYTELLRSSESTRRDP